MQYLLQFTYRPGEGPEEGTPEFDDEMKVWHELNEELKASGQYLAASGLKVDAATTVRKTGDEVTVTDGPFAETKEVLSGFYLVEAASPEEAMEIAKRIPTLSRMGGAIEVRQIVER